MTKERKSEILKEFAVPFIKVNAEINYDELCNKHIKNTDGALIKQAVQIVDFELDNYGGNVTIEAGIRKAEQIIDEGLALKKLEQFREESQK